MIDCTGRGGLRGTLRRLLAKSRVLADRMNGLEVQSISANSLGARINRTPSANALGTNAVVLSTVASLRLLRIFMLMPVTPKIFDDDSTE
jgi:hypothetical protein